jgi:hypothetical protein
MHTDQSVFREGDQSGGQGPGDSKVKRALPRYLWVDEGREDSLEREYRILRQPVVEMELPRFISTTGCFRIRIQTILNRVEKFKSFMQAFP